MSSDWYGSTFEVRLGPPGHGGFCVARHEGRVLFVRHGLPGELVRAQVTEDRGGSFCRADAIEILEPSPDRIPATCPVSGPGGAGCCDFTFATPEAQRDLKHQVVADQLRRLANWEPDFTVEPIPLTLPSSAAASQASSSRAGRTEGPARLGGVPTRLASSLLTAPEPGGRRSTGTPSEQPHAHATPPRPATQASAAPRPPSHDDAGVPPGRIGGVATHLASALIASPAAGVTAPSDAAAPGTAELSQDPEPPGVSASLGEAVAAPTDSSSSATAGRDRGIPDPANSTSGAVAAAAPTPARGGATASARNTDSPAGDRAPQLGALSHDAYAGGWRSRVRLAVDADGRAGVHRYRSAEVIADLRCPQPMAGAMAGIGERKWTPGADLVVAVDGDGMRHIVEVAPAEVEDGGRRGRRGHERGRGSGGRAGDRRSTAARRAAAHGVRDERVVEGTGRAVQYVADRRWELSATGFWQPHYGAAQCYSDVVAEWADAAPGSLTWDLYCGVGVFAARLAGQVGSTGSVHGVEFARSAVSDGRAALRDLPWVDLSAERVERWIVEQPGTAPDVVVLDPPRAGAGKEVISALSERSPRRIIHIGCDPAAFARDIGLYRAAGYQPVELRVFDAFPGTHHVECVAALER